VFPGKNVSLFDPNQRLFNEFFFLKETKDLPFLLIKKKRVGRLISWK
jgi:hypothetical protein